MPRFDYDDNNNIDDDDDNNNIDDNDNEPVC